MNAEVHSSIGEPERFKRTVRLNIFQDLASPHNNVLVAALMARNDVTVKTWYAHETMPHYPQSVCYAHELGRSQIFGGSRPSLSVLWYWLTHPDEKYLVVGWSNPTQRSLMVLSWICGRQFAYWSDHPKERVDRRLRVRLAQKVFLRILARSSRPFFAVGRHTIEYYAARGIPRDAMVNMPIFVDVPTETEESRREVGPIRRKYGVEDGQVFVVAGSHFVREKGYDVLLEALGGLEPTLQRRYRLLLVGAGPEEPHLRRLIESHELTESCLIVNWMPASEFIAAVGSADVFVHPARFDAWGGGTLHAMALGVPVIGSTGAGSANDRVVHGVNGFLYENDDPERLRACIRQVLDNPEKLKAMGECARATANRWKPEVGAELMREAFEK